jgi:hypothetical protein
LNLGEVLAILLTVNGCYSLLDNSGVK